MVDQTQLPFCFEVRTLRSCDEVVLAIKNMVVRGAPLIGASAACGLRLATLEDPSDDYPLNPGTRVDRRPTDGHQFALGCRSRVLAITSS
ncbi:MAG: hypothetical protein CM1200mP41_32090 [Gammaproteobacteria bacterium]|nr:MAG: hypothetical protein CM1200mP41_32090 [Gammaproteobacteria bacterium]